MKKLVSTLNKIKVQSFKVELRKRRFINAELDDSGKNYYMQMVRVYLWLFKVSFFRVCNKNSKQFMTKV